MDPDSIVANVKNWQRQMGMWQFPNGKIDKQKAEEFRITNVPSENQQVEYIIYNQTPLQLIPNGNFKLWDYVSQYTWIPVNVINENLPNNQLVIVKFT